MKSLVVFSMVVLPALFIGHQALAKTVKYDLTIEKFSVNLSGKKPVNFALSVNGSIPAPTLEFTEGDTAEITVHNTLASEEVSIHWHGILLPPIMDGVPYVNTPPIFPGSSFTFRFTIRQHGTFWYHSHTMLQEQKGVYGAFVIHPRKRAVDYDKELVLVLSDWSDEDADQIMRNLRKDGDYYLYKKKSVRSYWGAIRSKSLGSHLANEWSRMGGMDLSDVGYDAFLINGKREAEHPEFKPGEKIRLRIINAAASTYFYLALGRSPVRVISADGMDIDPQNAKEILIGMAETYDILFTVPEGKSVELRATSQDMTGSASVWIGKGDKVYVPDKAPLNLYASMDHSAHKSHDSRAKHAALAHAGHGEHAHAGHGEHAHAGHGEHAHAGKKPVELLTVDEFQAQARTAFESSKPAYELKLVLGGDMERYVWHINGKAIHEDRNIEVNEGDVVRFIFENETMMHHPMHLHGHFFRVINKAGERSPLKHTVDVPPHGSRTIEFLANERGQWMLHCHNLYHMKTGMARVVRYTSYRPSEEMAKHDKHDPHLHEHLYFNGMVEAATNHVQSEFRLSRTWDAIEAGFESREYTNLEHAEGDVLYRRWFNNYFSVLAGVSYFAEFEKDTFRGVIGIGNVLPMLIEAQLFIDHTGHLRLDLEKRFQWTSTIFSDVHVSFRQQAKTDLEVSLMYSNRWDWAAGLKFTESDVGVGLQYKF